jgi:hypothetical protein
VGWRCGVIRLFDQNKVKLNRARQVNAPGGKSTDEVAPKSALENLSPL